MNAATETRLRALVFDVDGTLADTEQVHLQAFNEAFAAEGLDWTWDEPLYTRLLEVSGGRERILHYWREVREAGRRGLRIAIATTTSPVNIAALLRRAIGPAWRLHIPVVCDASSAPRKKPHPQVYLQALEAMQLPAGACLAFEDSANGLRAARAAGLPTVITPTRFTQHHDFSGALRVLPGLAGVCVDTLAAWRAECADEVAS